MKMTFKTKEDYKKHTIAMMSSLCTANTYHRVRMGKAYEYVIDDNFSDPYEDLMKTLDVKDEKGNIQNEVPVIYSHFKKIRSKIKNIEGELKARGFAPDVKAINRDAQLKFKDEVLERRRKQKMQPDYVQLADASGIPLGVDETIPETEQELLDMLQRSYKSNQESYMIVLLKASLNSCHYKHTRLSLFRDVLIAGECHAIPEVRRGFVGIKRLNPMRVIVDRHIDSNDHLTESKRYLIAHYMSIPDAVSRYDLDEKAVYRLCKEFHDGLKKLTWNGATDTAGTVLFAPFIGTARGSELAQNKVLVIEAFWEGFSPAYLKTVYDKHGNEHNHSYYDVKKPKLKPLEKQRGGKVEEKPREIIRTCTLIAGEFVGKFGLTPNRTTDVDNPFETQIDICSFIPYLIQGKNNSLAMDMMPLEGFRNYLMSKIQLEIHKSGGAGQVIDLSKLDPTIYGAGAEAIERFNHYYKGSGLIFINSATSEGADINPNGSPVNDFNSGIGLAIEGLVRLVLLMDQEIDEKTSTGPQQMGQVVPNQLNHVTDVSLQQSAKTLTGLLDGFNYFENRLLSKMAEKIKLMVNKFPDRYYPLLGETLMKFVSYDAMLEIPLNNFGVQIVNDPVSQGQLRQRIEVAIQQGQISLIDALEVEILIMDLGPREAIKKLVQQQLKREAEAQAFQNQQMQQQLQAQAAMKQQEREAALQNTLLGGQLANEGRQISAQGQIQATTGAADRQSEAKILSKKMELDFASIKNSIDNAVQLYLNKQQ